MTGRVRMSRWERMRDNLGFAMAAASFCADILLGLNAHRLFNVSEPYYILVLAVATFALGCFAGWWLRDAVKRARQRERREARLRESLHEFRTLGFDDRCLVFACVTEGEQVTRWGDGVSEDAVSRFAQARHVDGATIYTATDDACELFNRFPELKGEVERDLKLSSEQKL